jgi:acetyltransferase-like isoleucine patch superfamily enzyme
VDTIRSPTRQPDASPNVPTASAAKRYKRIALRRTSAGLGRWVQRPRVWKYRALSTCPHVIGSPTTWQPVLFLGEGAIVLGHGVEFGWPTSAAYYSGYCHVEARCFGSVIEVGDGARINNNAFIKSEGPGVRIGRRALIGSFVEIFDSDFHDLRPDRRHDGEPRMAAVDLGEDVFIGDGVKVLKGVTIGRYSVIGAGSVVTSSIPAGVVAAGNPARVLRELDDPPRRPVSTASIRTELRATSTEPDRAA